MLRLKDNTIRTSSGIKPVSVGSCLLCWDSANEVFNTIYLLQENRVFSYKPQIKSKGQEKEWCQMCNLQLVYTCTTSKENRTHTTNFKMQETWHCLVLTWRHKIVQTYWWFKWKKKLHCLWWPYTSYTAL